MTFPKYIKILKRYYGGTENNLLFAKRLLTATVTNGCVTENSDASLCLNGDVFLTEPMADKLYSRGLSSSIASLIVANMDKEVFAEFLRTLSSVDAIDALKTELGYKIEHDYDEFISNSTDTFFNLIMGATTNKQSMRLRSQSRPDMEAATIQAPSDLIPTDTFRLVKPKRTLSSGLLDNVLKPHVPAKEFINREAPRKLFYDTLNGNPPFEKTYLLMRDEIKRRLDDDMKRSVDVEMIGHFKGKLT
jgi:hypothetical protein